MTDDATQNSGNSQVSWLAQKLQRRGVEVGVINTRQLPTQQTYATIHRMVEREHLSSQIESRYRAVGVVSPLELPGRSRVETLDQAAPALVTPMRSPMLQRADLPDLDRVPHRTSASMAMNAPPLTPTLRVSHKLASEAIVTPMISEESSAPSPVVVPGSVAESALPSIPEPTAVVGRVRVQRPSSAMLMRREEAATASLVMAEPHEEATTERSRFNPIASPVPTETGSMISEPHRPLNSPESAIELTPTAPPSPPVTGSQGGTSLPLVISRSPLSRSTEASESTPKGAESRSVDGAEGTPRVQAKLGDGARSRPEPVIPEMIAQPLVIARFASPASTPETARLQVEESTVDTGSTITASTLQRSSQSPERPLARNLTTATLFPTTTVMIQPLTQSSSEPRVTSGLRRHPTPEPLARSPLPLHTQGSPNTIVRQPEASGTVESVPTPATLPPPPPAEKSTEPEADVKQIAEQVSRILMRQLTVERERRGMQRW